MPRSHQPINITLDSACILQIEYQPNDRTLDVLFHSGNAYRYDDVPLAVVSGLIRAESAGRYYGKHIRGQFQSHRI